MRIALLALFACGRINFDPGDAATSGPDATYRCAAKDVDVGQQHTCAIDSLGAVWCWGVNAEGQSVFSVPTRAIATPTRVDLPTTAAQVAVGGDHTCARLDDGDVWCWGANTSGQLGNGNVGNPSAPARVELGSDRAIDLDTGTAHVCIRRALDSAVMCWGDNQTLQIGVAGMALSPLPVLVAGTAGAKQIELGHRHSCAIDALDQVVCWGRNAFYQLGSMGPTREMPQPVAGLGPVARVAGGGPISCAVETSGNLRCWGKNTASQLGTPASGDEFDPQPALVTNVADVQVQGSGGYAITRTGAVMAWGGVFDGNGVPDRSATFVPHAAGVGAVSQLAAEYAHTCAVAGGALVCWGPNTEGELGRGVRSISLAPVPVDLGGAVSADRIAVGFNHACAHTVPDAVFCWGNNGVREVGVDGDVYISRPQSVATGLATVENLSSTYTHTCAWGGGMASCWGANSQGQLGRGTTSQSEVPSVVAGLAGVTRVVTGWSHTCAQVPSGVVCWGLGTQGELGDGAAMSSLAPVQVMNLPAPITDLAAGGETTCAVANGGVWCWGLNNLGQIGDGSQTNRPAPINIAVPGTATHVHISAFHACATNSLGNLYCWGNNVRGELGLGDSNMHATPTQVALPAAAVAVVTSFGGGCVKLVDDRMLCWGSGDRGALGDGQEIPVPTPTPNTNLAAVDAIGLAFGGGCALRSNAISCWGAAALLANGDVSGYSPAPPQLNCP